MCGIVGIWNTDGRPVDRAEMDIFTDTLAHRGPDGRGVHVDTDASLGLGHRRLSILDLSDAGRQPMSYADGRYWITFNGEIYNFLELRAELQGLGYAFRTETDTEVILAAYDRWGDECQLRFNGMWAFAVWDRRERALFLSRDRFGIKPLHYGWNGKRLAFASELKAFLALECFDGSFDEEMVAFSVMNPSLVEGVERTMLKGFSRLLGGHSLRLKAGGRPEIRRWWNTLDHLEEPSGSYSRQAERYRELLFDACRIRMRSDVALGTSLSGGLDSSSVLCVLAAIQAKGTGLERTPSDWQSAFIARYPGTDQDETEYANAVVAKTGTRARHRTIRPQDVISRMDDIIYHQEDVSDVHVGPWQMYEAQRKDGIVVSVDGHGGDEALAGYWYYVREMMMDALAPPVPRPIAFARLRRTLIGMYANPAAATIPTTSQAWRQYIWPLLAGRMHDRAHDWFGTLVSTLRRLGPGYAVLRGAYRRVATAVASPSNPPSSPGWLAHRPEGIELPVLAQDADRVKDRDVLFKAMYRDFHGVALPTNLSSYDRLSMAHGVEVRCPFCDWRLVTYSFSLPSSCKVHDGYTKRILRDALKNVLPPVIRRRKTKIGFANPQREWLGGPLRSFMLDSVRSAEFQESGVWNGPVVAEAVEKAFREDDFGLLGGAWSFVQGMNLMRVFRQRRGMLRSRARSP